MANQTFLRDQLLDLQVKADELDVENIRLGKENEKYECENKKLHSKISELNNQLCNMIDRKEFEELTNKYEILTERLTNVDKNLKSTKKENETLNNTYENFLKNFTDMENKYEICKQENNKLKSDLNELKNISKETLTTATIKSDEVEQQHQIISALQEENESLKTHLNYLREQNKKNVSILSCGDSFSMMEQFNNSISVPESMDIIVEAKLRDCQKQLEETESRLKVSKQELYEKCEQITNYQTELELRNDEISSLEKQKIELEEHFECATSKKNVELNNLNQQLIIAKADNEKLNANLLEKDEQLKSSAKEIDELRQLNEQQVKSLEIQLKEINEKLAQKEEEISRLTNELIAVRKQSVEEQSKLREQMQNELDEQVKKHQAELNVIHMQQEQKLSTLTAELAKQEDEQIKMQTNFDESKSRISELQSNYDQLLKECEELKKRNEIKDNKLIDLESENEKLNIELSKYGEEIKQIHKCLNEEITLTQSLTTSELMQEKETILAERNELEKQVKELQSELSQAKNDCRQLMLQHQEEIFKLSETMKKKQDESKLRSDIQIMFKELKCKEDQLIELKARLEKREELNQNHLISIEKLKAANREKNHSIFMLKQKFETIQKDLENKIKSDEVELKKLKANLKCAEDSFDLERKNKECYYREMTELEKRLCVECRKLERSNSITFNARDQTLLVKNLSNPQLIQKIPNPSKYMMEDEEGEFMTNTNINEIRKRKTDRNDQEEFNKRMNILQQRNLKQLPHLKTSYAIEFQDYQAQEVNSAFLNEKIKNSEKFVSDENIRTPANPSALRQFSSLRFRKA